MLDEALVTDCPYGPEGLFIDEILEVDHEARRVVARMPTHPELPLTRAQRVHPRRHPRHVAAGLMVHVTGIMGYLHLFHIEGLRHLDGWSGFGVRIHEARFSRMAEVGPPLSLSVECGGVRRVGERLFSRYRFRFHQEGELFYRSEQSAVWTKVEDQDGASLPRP